MFRNQVIPHTIAPILIVLEKPLQSIIAESFRQKWWQVYLNKRLKFAAIDERAKTLLFIEIKKKHNDELVNVQEEKTKNKTEKTISIILPPF